jgi:hypothetical protein
MEKSKFQPVGRELAENDKPTRVDCCATCKFGDVDTEGDGFLLCRRNPPRATPIIAGSPTGPKVLGTISSLPRVGPNEWCGEWSPAMAIAS